MNEGNQIQQSHIGDVDKETGDCKWIVEQVRKEGSAGTLQDGGVERWTHDRAISHVGDGEIQIVSKFLQIKRISEHLRFLLGGESSDQVALGGQGSA